MMRTANLDDLRRGDQMLGWANVQVLGARLQVETGCIGTRPCAPAFSAALDDELQRMDARRGAQPMALPLARVAAQTPLRRAARRAGSAFGALCRRKTSKMQ